MSKFIGFEEKSLEVLVEDFRERWPHGKLSLLAAHIFYAIDETRDILGWTETEDMDECEKMFLELLLDLKKCVPVRKEKFDIKEYEKLLEGD